MPLDPNRLIDALSVAHRRLAMVAGQLTPEALVLPSYCPGWSRAQLLAHLGAGAEVVGDVLEAARTSTTAPAAEARRAVYARWEAKTPAAQATEALEADAALVERLRALDDAARRDTPVELLGATRGVAELVAVRLSEETVHGWDLAVSLDAAARLPPEAAAALLGVVELMAPVVAHRAPHPVRRAVVTSEPEAAFLVEREDGVTRVVPLQGEERVDVVHLPAEAFVRLVYGRLDAAHAPELPEVELPALEELRALFRGF